MQPAVGRTIGQGFRTAGRSWAGIGVFAGGWLLLWVVVTVLIALTGVPRELIVPPPPVSEVPAPPEGLRGPAVQGAPSPADLFGQMSTPPGAQQPAPAETAVTPPQASIPTQATQAAAPQAQGAAARERALAEWLGRAWPVLGLCVVVYVAVSLWLTGGQIGYLAKRVTTQQARLSEYWTASTKAFGSLLGASLLLLLALAALVLLLSLFGAMFSPLSRTAPTGLRVALGLMVGAAVLVGLVWVAVRLSFWFIMIVVDRLGPLASLKASFRATRGRWWRVFGLGASLWLISLVAYGGFMLLNALAGFVGGLGEVVIILLGVLLYLVAYVYLEFTRMAAYLHFYEAVRAPSAS